MLARSSRTPCGPARYFRRRVPLTRHDLMVTVEKASLREQVAVGDIDSASHLIRSSKIYRVQRSKGLELSFFQGQSRGGEDRHAYFVLPCCFNYFKLFPFASCSVFNVCSKRGENELMCLYFSHNEPPSSLTSISPSRVCFCFLCLPRSLCRQDSLDYHLLRDTRILVISLSIMPHFLQQAILLPIHPLGGIPSATARCRRDLNQV